MKRVQKSKESESTPSIGSKIKTFLIKTFFVALVIGVAFGAGTFKPNFIIVKQIQQDEDRKMVALAKEFGLHEPEFSFKNNKEFVLSMNKCIDYLNWTTASAVSYTHLTLPTINWV